MISANVPASTIFSIKTKIALIIAVVFWSSAFVGIRVGLQSYSPGSLALLRFLIASLCVALMYWRLPRREKISSKDFILLICIGIIGVGCYNIFLNYAELTISSGVASFVVSQSPLITLLLAILFLREGFNIFILLGILISIFGVGLITLGENKGFNFDVGMVYILLATLISGLYSVLQKIFLKKYHAIDVTVYIIWGGTLSLLIYFPELFRDIKTASLNATLAVIYLGIFPAAVAYIAWSYALAAIPASRCVSFLYFMPLIATFLGWVCLGEVPAFISLVGGLIALFGVWVANRAFMRG